jgi:hypothetical protein
LTNPFKSLSCPSYLLLPPLTQLPMFLLLPLLPLSLLLLPLASIDPVAPVSSASPVFPLSLLLLTLFSLLPLPPLPPPPFLPLLPLSEVVYARVTPSHTGSGGGIFKINVNIVIIMCSHHPIYYHLVFSLLVNQHKKLLMYKKLFSKGRVKYLKLELD